MSCIKKITMMMLVALCCIACDSLEGDIESMRATSTLVMVDVGSFSIGKYPVTEAAYNMVMHPKPTNDLIKLDKWKKDFKESGALPVVNISWYEAIVYCNKLSKYQGLDPVYTINGKTDPEDWVQDKSEWVAHFGENTSKNGYRLPTTAEWEQAAGGGDYSGSSDAIEVAWYSGNSKGERHYIGQLKSNSNGIYDMSGNVDEWCMDGASTLSTQGGNFNSSATALKLSAAKATRSAGDRSGTIGLRLVRKE